MISSLKKVSNFLKDSLKDPLEDHLEDHLDHPLREPIKEKFEEYPARTNELTDDILPKGPVGAKKASFDLIQD